MLILIHYIHTGLNLNNLNIIEEYSYLIQTKNIESIKDPLFLNQISDLYIFKDSSFSI